MLCSIEGERLAVLLLDTTQRDLKPKACLSHKTIIFSIYIF